MRATAQLRGGSRLRRRLVLQLVLVTAAACGLMAWASYELVRRTFDGQLVAELNGNMAATAAEVASLGSAAEAAVEALAAFLEKDDPGGLGRLLAGGPAATGEAAQLMSRARLQWLEILDGQGTLLSSAVWPEQAGLRQPELMELPADRTRLVQVTTATHTVPAFVARRELRVGSRVVHLVGGLLLDEAALARCGRGDAWLLVESGNGERSTVGTPRVDPVAQVPGGTAEVTTADRSRWLVAHRDVDSGDAIAARLYTAISRDANDRRLRRVRGMLAALAVLAAGLAGLAGVWIARRVTAPVAELVRSVDAIAAGTEDYTFDRSTEDEFEELTTSFSRLHRSLALSRQRSRAAERVAAWRDVARRVAHEVKNPLAPIRLTIENLVRARRRPGPESARLFDEMFDEGAGTIMEEVDRLKRLVGEFSEFARLPLPEPRPLDLARLIDDVAALYGAEAGLEVEVRHHPDLPPVRLDADQISRAFQNVFGNAIEAMRTLPAGRPRRLVIRTSLAEGELVRIDVDDSGPGLSTEALDKLFEPYFTTKESGTGLGLSITYRIITEHGGVIAANNRDEGGLRVTIRLPL